MTRAESPRGSSAGRAAASALVLLCGGAIAGHVAYFLLLSPDPWVLGFSELAGGRVGLAALLIGAQILTLTLFARSVRAARSSLRESGLGGGTLIAALSLSALAVTAVTARPALYPLHLAMNFLLLALALATVAGAAVHAGARGIDGPLDRALASEQTRWWLACAAAGVAALLNRLVFDGIPHIPDEVVYFLQAGYLSKGTLYLTGIPAAALDVISTSTHAGRWFGIFPVGWPAILALGVRAGVPWLMNPLLTAILILVAHGLIRRVWDLGTANLAAFFLATSPWLLFLGASFMSHTAAIAAGALAARGALETARGGRLTWSLGGGTALGVLVLIRPFEGVLVGLVCAAVVLLLLRRRAFTPGAALFAAAAVLVGGITLPYNRALTGRALLDPITQYFDREHYPGSNRLGFGPDVGNVGWANDALPGHGPVEAVINANWNASLVQIELFGWGFGSLLIVFLALAQWRRIARREPLLAALLVVALIAGAYTLYWYSAADFGARYWSQMIVPLTAITAVALFALPSGTALRRVAVLASLLGAPVVVMMRSAIKYEDYRGMTRGMERLAEAEGFGNDLVLVRGGVFSDHSAGLILNPPAFEGSGPLYFRWVEGEDLSLLRARFPGRGLWIVDGSSLTGGPPRVVSGPLP